MPRSSKIFSAKFESITKIAEDTYQVVFDLGDSNFKFDPGQYVWVDLGSRVTSDPRGSRRAFSLVSTPDKLPKIVIAFRVSPSEYKRQLLALTPGDKVEVIGGFGAFYHSESCEKILFIAGGVGVCPYVCLLSHFANNNFPCKIDLLVANSSPERSIYESDLKEIAQKFPEHFTASWQIGKLNLSATNFESNLKSYTKIFLTGSKEMVLAVTDELLSLGVTSDRLCFEEFSGLPSVKLGDLLNDSGPFKLAVQSANNHIVITDKNGVIRYANQAAERLTGFTLAEMQGNTPRLWGGEMANETYKKLWSVISLEKKPFKSELTNRRKNGELYQVIATVSPILDTNGEILGYIGSEEDISIRVEMESQMQDLRNFLDSVVEQLPEMLFIKDAKELQFVRVNKKAEEILGLKREEMIGKSDYDFFPKDQADFFVQKDREVLRTKSQVSIAEEPIKSQGKGVRYLRTKKIAILDHLGNPQYLLGLSEDITEEKETNDKLNQKTEELKKMNELMVDREMKMIELKSKNAELMKIIGQPGLSENATDD